MWVVFYSPSGVNFALECVLKTFKSGLKACEVMCPVYSICLLASIMLRPCEGGYNNVYMLPTLLQVAAIGATTGDSLSKAGRRPDAVAKQPNPHSLTEAILKCCI